MKNFITLLMIILFSNFSQAQNNDYLKLWQQVKKFENEGLPKSALKVVEQISTLSKKNNDKPQQIKTLLYKSKYALTLEEDAQLKIINDFKTEISQSKSPTKNVLENMLATMYWQYFQQNRWKFYERTKVTQVPEDTINDALKTSATNTDFRTWDLQTLFDEIQLYFNKSLKNGLLLQQTNLSEFNDILHKQDLSKRFRPTVFDLLSHNALAFFKTDENSITKPAYKFEIDNEDLLKDAKTFANFKLDSKDSSSLELQALRIYQNLIKFHLKDKEPFALVDVNLERLKYVAQHATFTNKETLLLNTLKSASNTYKSQEISGLYDFEIAAIYVQQGNTYQPKTNTESRWKLKDALAICESVIAKYPKTSGAEKCTILKSQILNKQLNLTAEEVIPIQDFSRVLVRYKNINQLNFKVHKVSINKLNAFNKIYRTNEKEAFIKGLNVSTEWNSTLKNENDYQFHSTEIVVPKLENGHYIFVAKPIDDSNTFATLAMQVTNMAVVEKSFDDQMLYQIIDRNNGKPLVGVLATLKYQTKYNGSYTSKNLTTNTNGEFGFTKTKTQYINLSISLKYNNETAYFKNYRSRYYNRNNEEDKLTYNGFLFTDRSIYRPGQIAYFKGIALKTKDGKPEVLENENTYAILYNVNGEEVKKLELNTNEFGSVKGEFILPNDGLTGQFYIRLLGKKNTFNNNPNAYFSVEEYKRPKFETKFNPVTETYKINDSVTIKGNALAFAGSNITDAKVVYRVHRKVQYPHWYYWYRPYFNSEPQEIGHGESITDASGNFEITFKAIPDESVDKKTLPIFNYEITADVTDLNGETRSATTIVNVGYHALVANMSLDSKLDKTNTSTSLSKRKIVIDTKNLNGEFVPAKGTIKIYKLIAPETVLRQRAWQAPDYQVISENDFKSKFPHDAYDNEDNVNNWKKGKMVFDEKFDTKKSKELELGNIKNWESGKYIVLLESKDKFGQIVKDELKTSLYSNKDKTLADNQLFSISTNKNSYSTNDTVELCLGSAAENITVTLDVEKNHHIIKTYIVNLNKDKQTISIPVTKDDLGGFVIHYSFAAYNSYQGSHITISVPYPPSDLQIETLTFRDKLQPGTDETWSFKIKGPKGDKVSAELLASMYDASLDQFKPHNWNFIPLNRPTYYSYTNRHASQSFRILNFRVFNQNTNYTNYKHQQYDQLNWFGFYFGNGNRYFKRELQSRVAGIAVEEDASGFFNDGEELEESLDEVVVTADDLSKTLSPNASLKQKLQGQTAGSNITNSKENKLDFDDVQIRKNLQETAFFFPQLQTDAKGNVSFSFTTPEALTKWKLQLLAHTKTLESAVTQLETVTQKELMVIPNAPRFLREGDEIIISTKIANISDKALSGLASLELTNPLTGKNISNTLVIEAIEIINNKNVASSNSATTKSFTVDAKGNTQVSWNLHIPKGIQAVQYKIIAKAGNFSDGEQNALPVLTNRMLVTETLPMWIRSNQTKTFTLDKLASTSLSDPNNTLSHHKLTLEMTSNPAWYAVQALPYLMEYPYECNEQTFSRFYANALASHIANSNPRIQEVFNQWASQDVLISNLEKNQELKSILIQETPWLRDAQSETEQKKRIALLFDLNKMNNELQSAMRKLKNNQMNNGAWSWFNGGRENRYITQHIITGFGHLNKLGVIQNDSQESMINKAINYLDAQFVKEYRDIRKYNADVDLTKDHLSYTQLHYLYMRSFFSGIKKSKEVQDITNYYQTQIQKYWLSRSLYAKGLMALVVDRMNDKITSAKILKSLKETSITSEELGMYWKANTSSWYWYQAPIETQALLIETFSEIENNTETIDNLKIWLLKNKQTNQWKTTKATTEAVYALLLQGSDWLSVTDMVNVVLGGQQIEPSKLEAVKIEAGTGYYKTAWNTTEIKPEMAEVKITKKGKGIAWGSLYWQYFEDLDKITSAETPLKLSKKLFLKSNTDTGEEISEITSDTKLKVGDLVRVRIELRSDRDMEFIHMKDTRAAGLEPINILSQYKWQDGLGYYESTKDASTNFFFDYLPKGIYVFEYDLRVNNAGNMSNGITTIQSMYAPEFSSHSEGVRIKVN